MPTRLSSLVTNFHRVAFASLWIAGFGTCTVALWLGFMDEPEPAPVIVKLGFLLIWLLGSTFMISFIRRISDVWIDQHDLIVVRGRSEERIPLAAIEDVTETHLVNPKQIKLRIQRGAASRDSVMFLAPWTFQLPFSTHPVVSHLQEAIEHARSRRQRRP